MARNVSLLVLLCAPIWLAGCAMIDQQPAAEETAHEASAALFEQRCDEAMLKAALARWNDGDSAGCQMLLERLLHRSPAHLQARLVLADLYSTQGNIAEAENQLRWIVQQNPHNPQARHALGMLLETSGRRPEALVHLQAAAQLEPDNRFYGLCHHAAAGQLGVMRR